MKNTYYDLINQTFDFPAFGFNLQNDSLTFYDIPLTEVIEKYGTPLKLTYLPKITEQIEKARSIFHNAMEKNDYKGKYIYSYCTKSSHFSFVVEQVLKNGCHIETSSSYDLDLLRELHKNGKINKDMFIICNGYKMERYVNNIAEFINNGFGNIIPVLDNKDELAPLEKATDQPFKIGIRIAAEEEPSFEFYTSRLGIRYNDIVDFYKENIKGKSNIKLKMLHFFINTGIKDSAYYWSELNKCVKVYCDLKKINPDLDSLNIGGGLPVPNSLYFDYDYDYMIGEIIKNIKIACDDQGVDTPDIFTEFGSFTIAESGCALYSVAGIKQQNDAEKWYMIDSSFITTLPDTWGIGQRFIMLSVNNWKKEYQRVNLGGLTCDSQDYYNSEVHLNQVFLPVADMNEKMYIGFFHTGAYQESLSGYGGIKHCLIPAPKHIIVDKDAEGNLTYKQFAPEQSSESMLKVLGYIDEDNGVGFKKNS